VTIAAEERSVHQASAKHGQLNESLTGGDQFMNHFHRFIHRNVCIVTIGMCLMGCAVSRNKKQTASAQPQFGDRSSAYQMDQRIDEKGFTILPEEQFVEKVETPFNVPTVRGAIFHGEYHDEVVPMEGVLIEVRGPDSNEKIWRTVTDEKGNFKIDGLPFGEYAFKTSFHGFQPVIGLIILSKEADRKSTITIRLHVDK
jgi:hypothetical protein